MMTHNPSTFASPHEEGLFGKTNVISIVDTDTLRRQLSRFYLSHASVRCRVTLNPTSAGGFTLLY
jgi:hypothetical protein